MFKVSDKKLRGCNAKYNIMDLARNELPWRTKQNAETNIKAV